VNGTWGSPNWSGYIAQTSYSTPQSNSVTYVTGTWTVPTVTYTSSVDVYSCIWVGIDGWNGNTVEQVGTNENVVNGQHVYNAWWEMYSTGSKQPQQIIKTWKVDAGDSITALVKYITLGSHAGQFYLSIVDNSQLTDLPFSIYTTSAQYQSPLAQRSTAEWIVEAPTLSNGSIAPLANFGTVTFTNCSATILGTTGPINDLSWQLYVADIVDSSNYAQDMTGPLNSTRNGFAVTWFLYS
jgi:hypothetical protein